MLKRQVLLLVVGIVAAASLAACGGSSDTPESTSDQAIGVAVDALPEAKGNPFNSVGTPGIYIYAAIYDPLTFVDEQGKVNPWLATSWKNTSPTTWDFSLREGVKFSNGEPLTAQGVADVINYIKENEKVSTQAVPGDLSNVASAKAVDQMTLEVTTSNPDPLLPNKMTELYLPAPKVLTQQGIDAIIDNPVGTGPFKVQNWGSNTVQLTAYQASWRAPKVGDLKIQALPDPASRVQALQSGQVDLVAGISPDQSKQLTGKTKADVTKAAQVMSLAFINTKGNTPLKKRKVRQALNYAVDKKSMAESLLLGKGEAMGQGSVPNAVGHNPKVEPFAHDPAKAKRLLDEAGYPDGFQMSADVVVGSFPADAKIYQLMKQDLAEVGVNVKLQQITFANWLKKYLANSWESEAFGLSWNSLPTMDGARAMGLFSCLKEPAFFCDKPTADLLKQARTNLDLDARDQQLQQVSAEMHDNPPALYLVRQVDVNGVSSDLHGYVNKNRFWTYSEMFKK